MSQYKQLSDLELKKQLLKEFSYLNTIDTIIVHDDAITIMIFYKKRSKLAYLNLTQLDTMKSYGYRLHHVNFTTRCVTYKKGINI